MKKYIGTKTVSAEPMLLGEFIKQTGRNPYVNDIEVHDNSEKGYIVEYKDGYKSWSPADVFEEAYHEIPDMKDRLDKLKEAAVPLIKHLCENYHPHVMAIVTPTGVEIMEGAASVQGITDFVVD